MNSRKSGPASSAISGGWRREAEARRHIEETKKTYYDARHNCWCYLIQAGGVVRYSDDGEPQGTAGQPMLNVFQRQEITNVCCVVTRYFGGILLGAGGLTRAYSKGAKDVLEAAGVCRMSQWTLWDVPCTYPLFERMKLEIAELRRRGPGHRVRRGHFTAGGVPGGRRGTVCPRLTEFSAGALEMLPDGEEFLPGPREAL